MDLLGGYGSDSDGEDLTNKVGGSNQLSASVASAKPDPSSTTAAPEAHLTSGTVSAALPSPKLDADEGLLSSQSVAHSAPRVPRGDVAAAKSAFGAGFGALPELGGTKSGAAGKTGLGLSGRRKLVQLQTMKPLTAGSDEDDDEQPKKKLKPSTRGLSFLDSLPQPKHTTGAALGSAGNGNAAAMRAVDVGSSTGTYGRESSASAAPAATAFSNDAFRVQPLLDTAPDAAPVAAPDTQLPLLTAAGRRTSLAEGGPDAALDAAPEVRPALPAAASGRQPDGSGGGSGRGGGLGGWGSEQQQQHLKQQQQQQQLQKAWGQPLQPRGVSGQSVPASVATAPGRTSHYQSARSGTTAAPDGNALLAEALHADSGRGGGGGGPGDIFAGINMDFKEISQAKLTYTDPALKAAQTGTKQALGKDYELTLRREADAAEPTKLHKRKHQLHSLWHASKVKELEMLSTPGAGSLKTKRETQAKYGWSS